MWLKLPAGLKTILSLSLSLLSVSLWVRGSKQRQTKEARRLFSDEASVKTNKIASWDIDWSSDDVTSSWGWRQEDINPRWDRALPAPQSSFNSSALRLHRSIPRSTDDHSLPIVFLFFITSFSIFIPKPNSKLPFFFLKWLSPSLWILLVTSSSSSAGSCLATSDAHDTLHWVIFAWLIFLVLLGENLFRSLRPSQGLTGPVYAV